MGDITKTIPAGQEYTENGVKKVSDGTDQITYVGKVEYGIDDPFVMTAITSLEYAGMRNGIMDVMTTFKHWLTIGVTASPAFKVRNLIRDSVQAIGTSDLGYNPIKNVVEGFKQSSRDKQEYVSALASGGLIRFGTMLEGSESARVRQLVRSGVKDSSILNSENKWREFYDKFLEPGVSAYNELGQPIRRDQPGRALQSTDQAGQEPRRSGFDGTRLDGLLNAGEFQYDPLPDADCSVHECSFAGHVQAGPLGQGQPAQDGNC
jgi:hypothetical protein